ncbi:hypothetical protein BO94DRAFT_604425 [Aspergillus sclerotioniger CBS 115572]|uniref:Uncharacterized protein n=1 Tax=Aspergillus sclerotioniger CBS 115572 TaxID=1450535 RepID=A0A317VW79_9EURO|nr:hypothetical protein BO94DRAFT_604425 [Aspergillus sclerotioniger CBS 115572]PWY77242.1 hypothetical protein BO94DRAFT_604425 [Aspergillus sclerotioniger CBS 115572]
MKSIYPSGDLPEKEIAVVLVSKFDSSHGTTDEVSGLKRVDVFHPFDSVIVGAREEERGHIALLCRTYCDTWVGYIIGLGFAGEVLRYSWGGKDVGFIGLSRTSKCAAGGRLILQEAPFSLAKPVYIPSSLVDLQVD